VQSNRAVLGSQLLLCLLGCVVILGVAASCGDGTPVRVDKLGTRSIQASQAEPGMVRHANRIGMTFAFVLRTRTGAPVYFQSTETTQDEYAQFDSDHESAYPGGNLPVTNVSWESAMDFCRWLSESDLDMSYRLPSMAEWRVACACEAGSRYSWQGGEDQAWKYANGPDPSAGVRFSGLSVFPNDDGYPRVAPVAQFEANRFGLFDMIGNVSEWCEDKVILSNGREVRVYLGGSWHAVPRLPDCQFRGNVPPDFTSNLVGFRVCCVPRE
jgi:formylglycine-generating enzyme required for sulfatase activity